jgi:hypothetical protein
MRTILATLFLALASPAFACPEGKIAIEHDRVDLSAAVKQMPGFTRHDLSGASAQYVATLILTEAGLQGSPPTVDAILEADNGSDLGVMALYSGGCRIGVSPIDPMVYRTALKKYEDWAKAQPTQ